VDRAGHTVRARIARAGALAGLALTSIVAAFATIAPVTEPAFEPTLRAEPLTIQPLERVLPVPEGAVREERYERGDTLASLLARLGVRESEAPSLLRLAQLRQLRTGTVVTAITGPDGELQGMDFLGSRDAQIRIAPRAGGFAVTEERAEFETRVTMKSNVIRSSLFAAADAAGIPDAVAIQVAEIFGGDIDFHRDLRRGDRFAVVYETRAFNGLAVRSGRVLAAEFTNRGRTYRAVWFEGAGADGHNGGAYYAPDGKSLRKAFLRSPLEFSRVSSGFGMRHHPILQKWRAHRGVDYAAPTGTRVRAVGDGTVEFAGRQGGYGNVVVLRHQGQFSTLYAHLSGFGRDVRKGARVAQGDVIGFVGQTGWATGPHLHYEFKVSGEARNPLAVALPAAQPVPAAEMTRFASQTAPLVARLELLASDQVALLE
jgi:murein DD-endopeptidase MepM/ murein hydrolase activator NlpD